MALVGSPYIPKTYQIILTVPGLALISIMACNVQRNLLSERHVTEEESGNVDSSGSSFTDITSFLSSRLYRSQGRTNDTGHIGVQADFREANALPTAA